VSNDVVEVEQKGHPNRLRGLGEFALLAREELIALGLPQLPTLLSPSAQALYAEEFRKFATARWPRLVRDVLTHARGQGWPDEYVTREVPEA